MMRTKADNLIVSVEFLNFLQLTISYCFCTMYLTLCFRQIMQTELLNGISSCVCVLVSFLNIFCFLKSRNHECSSFSPLRNSFIHLCLNVLL